MEHFHQNKGNRRLKGDKKRKVSPDRKPPNGSAIDNRQGNLFPFTDVCDLSVFIERVEDK